MPASQASGVGRQGEAGRGGRGQEAPSPGLRVDSLRLVESFIIQARDAVMITATGPLDPPGPRIVYVNDAFTRATGYASDEVLGRTPCLLVGDDTRREDLDALRRDMADGRPARGEAVTYRKDGTAYWAEWTVTPVADRGGATVHWVAVHRDMTERKALEETLRCQALHDPLTGLANRTLLQDRLRQSLCLAERDGRPLALLLLDLDGFKEVNDTFGHQRGDLVLAQVAGRLTGALRSSDTVARLGGDEFAVLLPGVDEDGAAVTARHLLQALANPIVLEDHSFVIGGSIGIGLAAAAGGDAQWLLEQADLAMYEAKRTRCGYTIHRAV